ncbi:glycoside hydrolase family 108 protein [Acidocella aminolytica]|uniref:glycoside hydrolase family 108 protein n=1 Tax=Acidocella aminolytica TaxID=33998 RepID=UPI001C315202|nr:glycosyl hydrolase 108 family protein [Acidocella aminolytica]
MQEEGGFVDNPCDPGRATKYGITIKTLSAWRKRACTVQDVKALSSFEAGAIYRAWYWIPGLPPGIDLMTFDFGVNAGDRESVELLQRAAGFVGDFVDGVCGPETRGRVSACNPVELIKALGIAQEAFYRKLPTFVEFGDGWTKRTDRREAVALGMVPKKMQIAA